MYSSFLKIRSPCYFSVRRNRLIDFSILPYFRCHIFNGFLYSFFFKLTFPYYDYKPSLCFQLSPYLLIPFFIARNFCNPKGGVAFRDCVILAAFVTMPEATMNEYDCSIFWEYKIWCPRKSFVVNPVPKSLKPKNATQLQLRLCRSGVNCCHIAFALFWGENVWHIVPAKITTIIRELKIIH